MNFWKAHFYKVSAQLQLTVDDDMFSLGRPHHDRAEFAPALRRILAEPVRVRERHTGAAESANR